MHIITRSALVIGLWSLAACTQTLPAPEYNLPRYDHLPRVELNAAHYHIVQQYQPKGQSPYIDNYLPISLSRAAEQVIKDRVQTIGDTGTFTFTITDAHVTETELPRTPGIKGSFTTDQVAQFEAHLRVSIHLDDDQTARRAHAYIHVRRVRSLSEDATPIDREQLLYELVRDVAAQFNSHLETRLKNGL